jgi:hypothetical protein
MRLLVAAFVLFGVLGVACSGDKQQAPAPAFEPPPTIDRDAVNGNGPRRPPADVAPVSAPAPQEVLANGDSIPFKVCSQRTGWQKPSPDEMAQVFTDRRFGDGVSPYPQEYALYLTRFYTLVPFANSVNKYTNAFSGFWDNSGQLEQFCDREELRKDPAFLDLQFVGYTVREIKRDGPSLVFVVEAGFNGWQDVVYPYPPDKSIFNIDQGFTSRQIVDTSGRLLYQDLTPNTDVAWQQTLQYDAGGKLQFVVIGGVLPYASAPITIGPVQPPLVLFSSSPEHNPAAGSVTVLDQAGTAVTRLSWPGGEGFWQPLGTLDLPPGTYTLRLDDALHDWHHFVLLAADVALPPGTD